LAILDKNIGRVMCQWWCFYREGGVGIKPRFIVDMNGNIRLKENPVRSKDDVKNLCDINFVINKG